MVEAWHTFSQWIHAYFFSGHRFKRCRAVDFFRHSNYDRTTYTEQIQIKNSTFSSCLLLVDHMDDGMKQVSGVLPCTSSLWRVKPIAWLEAYVLVSQISHRHTVSREGGQNPTNSRRSCPYLVFCVFGENDIWNGTFNGVLSKEQNIFCLPTQGHSSLLCTFFFIK